MKAYELLDKPERLNRHYIAADQHNYPIDPRNPAATSWCVLGALDNCYRGEEFWDKVQIVENNLEGNIISFNQSAPYENIISLLKQHDI